MTISLSPLEIGERVGGQVYPQSFTVQDNTALLLVESRTVQELLVLAPAEHPWLKLFDGRISQWSDDHLLKRCQADEINASALREALPALKPALLGLRLSAGFGDRLGLATPGHVRALRRADPDRLLAPIFAQQSQREMNRSGRTATQVLTDATWGAFQAGWEGPVGADADHLKTIEDINRCASAGFTFFTIDPGDFVDSRADIDDLSTLKNKADALPRSALESSAQDLLRRYAGHTVDIDNSSIVLREPAILRATAKYGRAIAHVAYLSRHLESLELPFELEISLDETETPTTHAEHIFIASELKRLGVRWVSLAPRFVGRFEKGVDYISPAGKIGDVKEFTIDVKGHAAIARALGPYKLSLHSGSDKFSIYPLVREATQGLVHLKTAGTSYLEALRVIARWEPGLFREIWDIAYSRYNEDRATYHVSAELAHVPLLNNMKPERFPTLLDDRMARQVLHVTFGSVSAALRQELLMALRTHAESYTEGLAEHFNRHIRPFVTGSKI